MTADGQIQGYGGAARPVSQRLTAQRAAEPREMSKLEKVNRRLPSGDPTSWGAEAKARAVGPLRESPCSNGRRAAYSVRRKSG